MTKRMKLVSIPEYERFKVYEAQRHTPIDGNKKTFFNRQDAASELLKDDNIPDDIKTKMFSNLLNSLNAKLSNINEPKYVPQNDSLSVKAIDEKKNTEESHEFKLSQSDKMLLTALPISIRWRGKYLLNVLKEYPHLISWDEKGNCVFFGELTNDGTNIIDLIRFVTSSVKSSKNPIGINRFLFLLKHINIPTTILTQSLRNEFLSKPLPKPRGNRESSSSVAKLFHNIFNWETLDEGTEPPKSSDDTIL
jgi:hypothetical protein